MTGRQEWPQYAVQVQTEPGGAWHPVEYTESYTREQASGLLSHHRARIGGGCAFRIVRRRVTAWEPDVA